MGAGIDSTDVVLILTGLLRVLIATLGVIVCRSGARYFPQASRFAVGGFSCFGVNSIVIVAIGFGVRWLVPVASVTATFGLALFLAVFLITAPPIRGRRSRGVRH